MQSTLSTVARGTAFEQRSLQLLQDCFSMSLRRVGGKSDGGVDLIGWWWLPFSESRSPPSTPSTLSRRRIRVLAQCKAEKKKFSPNYVREMEGVWHMHTQAHSPSARTSELGTVALLLSESTFTTATLTRALGSSVPFLLMNLPPPTSLLPVSPDPRAEGTLGEVGSAFWNPALSGAYGLLRGEFDVRWERDPGGGGRPGLWCRDKRVQSWTPDNIQGASVDEFGDADQ
ncbi:hypothetical protein K503DRAFT_573233 [Rhizopogon vinicolor AM-OR11-026]|uniref:Restriction endonuclease type IV Mrr domain-containing protein n=1 Tax=Rhizopogon vinicolor AM-OR11-026 TaxID=1314800 RepID=A0A1B7N7J4_9AGAM|nr:hypothetical protein K503DRAFT_573233 [Rhizopogon vinicolor AM-OR11-026]